MTHLEKMFGLKGKVAIVTGGARGIGKCAAENLAAIGADIALFDVLEEEAKKTAEKIANTYGVRAKAYFCDVTDSAMVAKQVAAVADDMGTLDLLFNNAGICMHKSALDVTDADWLKVVNINMNGVFYMAREFGRWLVAHEKGGSIVNTASMSADIINFPQHQTSYNSTKAAVKHMTKSLAVEWVDKNIRVNCISPGYIWTDLTGAVREDYRKIWLDLIPYHRMGTPQELAGAVIYLFSDSASYTNGCEIVIDGCFTVI